MVYTFVVSQEDSGRRLDLFLTEKIAAGYSRTFIQRLILNNAVTVNNANAKPHLKVDPQDTISVDVPELSPPVILPEAIALRIIYEDEDILIIDKPAGLTVHPGAGNQSGTLANALCSYTRQLSSINPERPGIVHRLDKETSGVMVAAKTNAAHLNLVRQFARHTIKRRYIAIVKGVVELDEGIIDLPIGRHKRDFRRLAVSFSESSRKAITRYKVINRLTDRTFLELTPETGRTHQLRVHLAHIGYPILGDSKYGRTSEFSRLALHARELGFFHPKSGKFVTFVSELPPEFCSLKKNTCISKTRCYN